MRPHELKAVVGQGQLVSRVKMPNCAPPPIPGIVHIPIAHVPGHSGCCSNYQLETGLVMKQTHKFTSTLWIITKHQVQRFGAFIRHVITHHMSDDGVLYSSKTLHLVLCDVIFLQ